MATATQGSDFDRLRGWGKKFLRHRVGEARASGTGAGGACGLLLGMAPRPHITFNRSDMGAARVLNAPAS